MREGESGADMGGKLRAVARRAEQIERRQRHVRRHGVDLAKRMALRKQPPLERQQLLEAVEKIVAGRIVLPASKRIGRRRVGARRAAEAEIDAIGKQALQHLEAFGDLERRVVRQHHAAGADAQMLGRRRDLPDHDVGR